MATIKSYTDLEQSKRLAELLPLESADMFHFIHEVDTVGFGYKKDANIIIMTIEQKAKAYERAIKVAADIKAGIATYIPDGTLTIDAIFPELKDSDDETIRKELIEFVKSRLAGFPQCDKYIAWLEKQGKQKPADKIKPKFKVGDWVVWDNKISCHIDNIYQGKESLMYTITDTHNMTRSYSVKGFDNNAHLWTIQDAKDGDVLCCKSGWMCIFKALDNHTNTFSSYCFMDNTKWFCETGSESHTLDKVFIKAYNGEIHPATKEQRNKFEKAMADAGYTFDFEKKELKKIKQKPAWSEEDVKYLYAVDMIARSSDNSGYNGIEKNDAINWLEGLQYRFELKKREQKTTDWTEEDEKLLELSISNLTELKDRFGKEYGRTGDCIEWLKSIKDRVQPQPKQEWKQENTGDLTDFENAMMHIGGSFFGDNAGLDPNDTNAIKEQANLLLELVQSKEWSKEDEIIISAINGIINITERKTGDWYYTASKKVFYSDIRNWLESLRPQTTCRVMNR